MNDLYIHQLETENKQLRQRLKSEEQVVKEYLQLEKHYDELEERIDKAIEYIKLNCTNYYVEKPNYRGVELLNIEELLEILEGKK